MQKGPEAPRIYAIREAIRATAQNRMREIHEVFSRTGALPPMASVNMHIDVTAFAPDACARLERYAEVPELALGMPYVIGGDGESAHFKDFRLLPPESTENPYRTFRRSVQDTFVRGWQQFEDSIETHHPGMLDAMRTRYQELLDKDPTSRHTGIPIDYHSFRKGVELGGASAYFALAVGLAIANSTDSVPSLVDATATEEQRTDLALSLSRMLRGRAIANITTTFWSKSRERAFAEWDKLRLKERPKGKYMFNERGGQFRAYDPKTDPPLSNPTIGCMALLFKLQEGDEHYALDNALFAAIRAAGDADLFNPNTAVEAWEQRGRVLKRRRLPRRTLAHRINRLSEDLTPQHGKRSFKNLVSVLEHEFI